MNLAIRRYALCSIVLISSTAGCASRGETRFVHPQADLATIRSVAVLAFTGLSRDAAEDAAKVQKIFLVELLATGVVEVAEPGRVNDLLGRERIESVDALPPERLQAIGEALDVDGLFLGSVLDFVESRSGGTPAPEVTLQLRLVEVRSGRTAWSTTATRSGAGARARLFGFGTDSLTETARKLIQEELRALVR